MQFAGFLFLGDWEHSVYWAGVVRVGSGGKSPGAASGQVLNSALDLGVRSVRMERFLAVGDIEGV